MIPIGDHAEGFILPVRAHAGARRAGIVGEHGGALKVAVTAPPEQGRANLAMLETLSEVLGLKRSQVQLLSGAGSRDKRFLVKGLTKEQLEEKIAGLLNP